MKICKHENMKILSDSGNAIYLFENMKIWMKRLRKWKLSMKHDYILKIRDHNII